MSDIELARALESGDIAPEHFHHESHLHVAWAYLSESSSVDEATAKMRTALRGFTAAAGKPEKYHETITLFWVRLLARLHAENADCDLKKIVRDNPRLLEKGLPLSYYSAEQLFSDAARTCWMEPDLKPLGPPCDCI